MKHRNSLMILSLLAGAFTYLTLSSSSSGVMGASTMGCATGGSCHNSGTGTTITLSGIPAAGFTASTTYTLTLSVNNSSKSAAGFDLSVNAGTMSAAPAGTMLMMGTELHHTQPKDMLSGVASWTFNWTAPASASSAVFNVAGNAVDKSNSSSGDESALQTFTFNKSIPSSVSGVQQDHYQIYPNPAGKSFTLRTPFTLTGKQLTAYSLTGSKFVLNAVEAGNNEYRINAEQLMAGVYIVLGESTGGKFHQTLIRE